MNFLKKNFFNGKKRFLAVFQLIRLPNIFTAISNVWAGALIANSGKFPSSILFATIASAALYGGGAAFNDYCDRDYDSKHRPKRPIPSGSISATEALLTGVTFFVIGILSGFIVSSSAFFIVSVIVLFAALYDGILKRWFLLAVVSMGLCRGFNWVLGLEAGGQIQGRYLLFPTGIFVYTAAISAVARFEVKKPLFKKVVATGVLIFPLIDGFCLFGYGYWWQGLTVCLLIVPALMLSRVFEIA